VRRCDGDSRLRIGESYLLRHRLCVGGRDVRTEGRPELSCAVYYRGSGERRADDVRLEGARLARGSTAWRALFPVADSPGFPDCNPTAFVDARGQLSVVWPAILDNRWESALLRYRHAPVAFDAAWVAETPDTTPHRP
jgi:hypothetical protein